MPNRLTSEEFAAALRRIDRTAFRLEIQPAYAVPYERELLQRFEAGQPLAPNAVPDLEGWFDQVRQQVRQGKTIQRVRVIDEPPTAYQRMARWAATWNTEAGEEIRYITRRHAHEIGLLPDAGPHDWWLLDGRELLVMIYDSDLRVAQRERVTDPELVVQAAVWRDLALQHSAPDGDRHAAA